MKKNFGRKLWKKTLKFTSFRTLCEKIPYFEQNILIRLSKLDSTCMEESFEEINFFKTFAVDTAQIDKPPGKSLHTGGMILF